MSARGFRRRRRIVMARRVPPGSAPGTLVADPSAPRPVIRVMAYREGEFVERTLEQPEQVREFVGTWPVTWINVDGLGDAAVVARLGELLGLHRLALEDVLGTHQRAKVEMFSEPGKEARLYVVVREVLLTPDLETDQISLFLATNMVVTFQERAGDCLDSVRERIRRGGTLRSLRADALAYSIIDAIVDGYFPVLEQMGERLQELEDDVVEHCDEESLRRVHEMKRDLLTLRRAVWPEREAINQLVRDPNPLISDGTRVYLRDCYDHVVQLLDMVETYRELGADLMDIYLSSVSNRLNAVMKVLTIIATIFMPLSFLAGVWGMNFRHMPELEWRYGYAIALAIMLAVGLGMLWYFWRAGWIGKRARTRERCGDRQEDGATLGGPPRTDRA